MRFLQNKFIGVLIFVVLMMTMFYCTFTLGKFPQDGILWLLDKLNEWIGTLLPTGLLHDFITNGVITGVGSVLAFLPNILILFFFMYLYEESGYLTHVADLLDKLMHHIGLHGNSVIPLLMGFGCNVPAILATKTIPDTKRRILTMLLIPFMSCSARLPILVLLVGTFFPQNPILVIGGLYGVTILLAIITAWFLDRFIFKTEIDLTPVEVLPLKKPQFKKVFKNVWDAGYEYIQKIGTIVLIAMMVIWFLSNFPQPKKTDSIANQIETEAYTHFQDQTYLARVGHFIEPALRPLGFDWKMSICLVSGLAAKEFIVGTMAILYNVEDIDDASKGLGKQLQKAQHLRGANANQPVFTLAAVMSFLIFVMLYMPCIATIITIKKESGSWKWALFSVFYSIGLAWIVAFVVYRIILLF